MRILNHYVESSVFLTKEELHRLKTKFTAEGLGDLLKNELNKLELVSTYIIDVSFSGGYIGIEGDWLESGIIKKTVLQTLKKALELNHK